MMNIQFLIYLFLIPFISCTPESKPDLNQGVVSVSRIVYPSDQSGMQAFKVSYKIWILGNASIQEVPAVNFVQDSLGNKTVNTEVTHYTFIDPDNKIYRNFANLSDPAIESKIFTSADSVLKDGAWDFYSSPQFNYDVLTKQKDTLINDVSYERFRVNKKVNDIDVKIDLHVRCDKKKTIVKFLKSVSDSLGCPVTQTDIYEDDKLVSTGKIEFIRDHLSKEEIKMFTDMEVKTAQ